MRLKGKEVTSDIGVPAINHLHPHKAHSHVTNLKVPLIGHPNKEQYYL